MLQQCSGINKTGERRGERCGQSKRSTHPYFCARHATQQHPLRDQSAADDDADADTSMPSPDRESVQQGVAPVSYDAAVSTLLDMIKTQMTLNQTQKNQTKPMPIPAPIVVPEPVMCHNIRVPEPVAYDAKQIDSFIKQQKEHHLQQEVADLRKQHRAKMVRLSGLLRDVEVAANNMCESIFQFKNAIDDDEL